VPPSVNKFDIYDKVLVELLIKLEKGLFFAFVFPLHKNTLLCGSLHCIIADDIAQKGAMV